MPKDVKGDILGFLKFQFVAKYQKIEEGRFGDTKIFRKKIERGPFRLVRFRKCTKKFLAEAGSRTCDRWVLPKSIKVCSKKWYIQSELCGLTKKKKKKLATVIVEHFSHVNFVVILVRFP